MKLVMFLAAEMYSSVLTLFGGIDRPWSTSQWTAINDKEARGGDSWSNVSIQEISLPPASCQVLVFQGNVDTQKLGGAGFAAQQTVASMPPFNLSGYEALVVDFGTPVPAEAKTFTLVLKDNDPNEDTAGGGGHGIQSTLGWEQNFAQNTLDKPESFRRVTLPMAGFQPFYRGRLVEDAPPLDVGSIKRLQLMCRSDFGKQSGPFQLTLASIVAIKSGTAGDGDVPSSSS